MKDEENLFQTSLFFSFEIMTAASFYLFHLPDILRLSQKSLELCADIENTYCLIFSLANNTIVLFFFCKYLWYGHHWFNRIHSHQWSQIEKKTFLALMETFRSICYWWYFFPTNFMLVQWSNPNEMTVYRLFFLLLCKHFHRCCLMWATNGRREARVCFSRNSSIHCQFKSITTDNCVYIHAFITMINKSNIACGGLVYFLFACGIFYWN